MPMRNSNPPEQPNLDSDRRYAQNKQNKTVSWNIEGIYNFIREKEQVNNFVSQIEGKYAMLQYGHKKQECLGIVLLTFVESAMLKFTS